MAAGWSTSRSLIQSWVVIARAALMSTRNVEPVTGWGRGTSTVVVAFCCSPSSIAGRSTAPCGTPSTLISTWVGTEWRPSATMVSGTDDTVTGAVRLTSNHWPAGVERSVVQAVAGSPSNAADAVCRLPFRTELARAQVTLPSWGRPRVSSIT